MSLRCEVKQSASKAKVLLYMMWEMHDLVSRMGKVSLSRPGRRNRQKSSRHAPSSIGLRTR